MATLFERLFSHEAGPRPRAGDEEGWAGGRTGRAGLHICFLFNHDQIHQIAHSLPIALAIADADPEARILLLTSTPRSTAEIKRLAGDRLGPRLRLLETGLTSVSSRFLSALLGKLIPARKLLFYRDHIDIFRELDALVVSEKTSLILKTRCGLKALPIIHTRHGAGDRAVGFDKASAGFDRILVSGPKIRDRLVRDAGVGKDRIAIVGYPKFDLAADRPRAEKLFPNDRPVVLYNPHASPHLSSWFRMGRKVLDYFIDDDRYNLIFAPHVMLFERPVAISIDRLAVALPGRIAERYHKAPNILVDLGSARSTDMSYTNAADIYLGDVSSQVYEFLLHPRPCVFLNAHGARQEGDPNYAHWRAGPVIDDPDDLGEALRIATLRHASDYRPEQEKLFRYTFDLTQASSSARAAAEILAIAAGHRANGP